MSDLRAARLTGVLFIIATVANLLGAVVRPADRRRLPRQPVCGTGPGGDRGAAPADRGVRVRGDRGRDVPRPQRTDTGLALGSVVSDGRGGHYAVAIVSLLSLLTLGQASAAAEAADRTALSVIGGLLLSLREHAATVGVFAFCLAPSCTTSPSSGPGSSPGGSPAGGSSRSACWPPRACWRCSPVAR